MLKEEIQLVKSIAREIVKEEIAKAMAAHFAPPAVKPAEFKFEKPKAQAGPLTKDAVEKVKNSKTY